MFQLCVIKEHQEHFISYYILIGCNLNFTNKFLLLFPKNVQTANHQVLLRGLQQNFKIILI